MKNKFTSNVLKALPVFVLCFILFSFSTVLKAQFCRLYGDMIVPNSITLFILAHIQANTSGYGEAMQLKCGNAIKHLADAVIFCKSIEKWEAANGESTAGQNIKCRIDKSPLGQPFLEVTIPLRFGYGLDDVQDVVTNAINWGIIKSGGSWYTIPFIDDADGKIEYIDLDTIKDESIKPMKVQGEKQIRLFFIQHPDKFALIDGMIRKLVLAS